MLVLQFRSFAQPAIVFASIPFAFSCAILALLAFDYSFSVMAFVGLTSLMGIVVNNSIILVDTANQLVKKGQGIREAIASAAPLLPAKRGLCTRALGDDTSGTCSEITRGL